MRGRFLEQAALAFSVTAWTPQAARFIGQAVDALAGLEMVTG
jgi:predicted Holliday junction resolvase-like endonuclease